MGILGVTFYGWWICNTLCNEKQFPLTILQNSLMFGIAQENREILWILAILNCIQIYIEPFNAEYSYLV